MTKNNSPAKTAYQKIIKRFINKNMIKNNSQATQPKKKNLLILPHMTNKNNAVRLFLILRVRYNLQLE